MVLLLVWPHKTAQLCRIMRFCVYFSDSPVSWQELKKSRRILHNQAFCASKRREIWPSRSSMHRWRKGSAAISSLWLFIHHRWNRDGAKSSERCASHFLQYAQLDWRAIALCWGGRRAKASYRLLFRRWPAYKRLLRRRPAVSETTGMSAYCHQSWSRSCPFRAPFWWTFPLRSRDSDSASSPRLRSFWYIQISLWRRIIALDICEKEH